MHGPEIRLETPSDEAQVREIQESAFGRPGEARLVDALRASAKPALSLVAEVDGRIAGHVFVSPVEQCSAIGREAIFPLFDRAFQVCELRKGALSRAGGWVRYHDAFQDL